MRTQLTIHEHTLWLWWPKGIYDIKIIDGEEYIQDGEQEYRSLDSMIDLFDRKDVKYTLSNNEEAPSGLKDTNPKDAVGTKKPPLSTVSAPVLVEVGTAMLEGARKYGRHNYRDSKVRTSVYYDATLRHLLSWWEGENIDPDSGMSHITKAIASLVVLRDAQINNKIVDDRPPQSREGWMQDIQQQVEDIFDRYPDAKPAHTHVH